MKDFKHMHTLVLRNAPFSCCNGYEIAYFYDVAILDVSCNHGALNNRPCHRASTNILWGPISCENGIVVSAVS